jgi:NAD(P)-dependent dehydrogenase (short-subunit alcohol dehydrogenase family)
MTSQFDLSDKVAIVVGGTKGMGETISRQFAASGARVLINSRTPDDVEALAAELNAEYGDGHAIAAGKAGDMSVKADLQALVDTAVATFGKVTSLVYCPSLRPWFGSSIETPDDEFDKEYLYFFKSKWWITSMCVPHMAKAGGGSVVYIGSGSCFEATSERSLTSCMRAAEVQMMKNFAAEFGQNNIRFNIISPGLIDAHGSKALFADKAAVAAIVAGMPMRRHGETSEISNVVTFLVSDASSFTTGAVVPVDGGRLLHAVPSRLTNAFAAFNEGGANKHPQ